MRRRVLLAAVGGFATGLLLLTIWFAPRVTGWEPSDRVASAAGSLTVDFNVPIRREGASDHLSIWPAIAGQVRVMGDQLVFEPAEPLEYGQVYSVTLTAGLRGENGLPLIRDSVVLFEVRRPRLIYLRELEGKADLWTQTGSGVRRQLTDEPLGVWDYSVLPEGQGVLVSSIAADDSDDLVLVGLDGERKVLLNCVDSQCRSGRWQPGGNLVAYERKALEQSALMPEVWLLDATSGRTWPAHDPGLLEQAGFDTLGSRFPRWSADGLLLAYYKPDARAVVVLDMGGGEPAIVPANLEIMGEWAPDNHRLAYTELAFGEQTAHEHLDNEGNAIAHDESSLYSHAVISDFEQSQTLDLAEGLEVSDSRPAWQPKGDRLALARTIDGSGRQIWVVRPEGGVPVALTDEPLVHHSALAWAPDGRQLAFMRTGLDGGEEPGVWLLDTDSGRMQLAEAGAFMPGWLP